MPSGTLGHGAVPDTVTAGGARRVKTGGRSHRHRRTTPLSSWRDLLGVSANRTLTQSCPKRLPLAYPELTLLSVEPNGPAERAGWLLGDILFALGDTPVSDVEEVQAALTPQSIHQPVSA